MDRISEWIHPCSQIILSTPTSREQGPNRKVHFLAPLVSFHRLARQSSTLYQSHLDSGAINWCCITDSVGEAGNSHFLVFAICFISIFRSSCVPREHPFTRPWIGWRTCSRERILRKPHKKKQKNEGAEDTVKMFLRGRRSYDEGRIMEVKRRAFSGDHRGRRTRVMFVVRMKVFDINWWIFRRTPFYRPICDIRRKCYSVYLLVTC